MSIAAIFNVWADCACLLTYAVENIRPHVDEVILVFSTESNRGEIVPYEMPSGCINVRYNPVKRFSPQHNELAKRNHGLDYVKKNGFTHFIMMDGDEFYTAEEFNKGKEIVLTKDLGGSVCLVKTYFKSPCLTIGYDHVLVPFIHKVKANMIYKLGYASYPFTYHNSGQARIDPTRRLNIYKGVEMLAITMHHYSYVRRNMALKLENSSANFSGSRSDIIYEDLKNASPGYHCKSYNRVLEQCENLFNLPEYE